MLRGPIFITIKQEDVWFVSSPAYPRCYGVGPDIEAARDTWFDSFMGGGSIFARAIKQMILSEVDEQRN